MTSITELFLLLKPYCNILKDELGLPTLSPAKHLKIGSAWFVSEAIKNKDTTPASRNVSHKLLEHWKTWGQDLFCYKKPRTKQNKKRLFPIHLLLATFE